MAGGIPSKKQLSQPMGGHGYPTRKSLSQPMGGHGLPTRSQLRQPMGGHGGLSMAPGGSRFDGAQNHILALRHFLRSQGYAIPATGDHEGHLMRSALKDWQSGVGKRDPHAWTEQFLKQRAAQNLAHDPTRAGPHGIDVPKTAAQKKMAGMPYKSGKGGGGGGGSKTLSTGPAQHALKAATGSQIPVSDANFGSLFNVDDTANAMAKEQFQPQINEAQLTVNQDPVQAAQNAKDVADWYNQVQSGLGKATASDKAATQAGVDSTQAATQAIVNSLGGSANQGSGEAAAAGQNVSGTLQAMGLAQSNLDSTLAPILEAQAAQQKTNQGNIDRNKLSADKLALSDLQGQEGNAETNAQMQLQSANNSLDQARQNALLQIQQYNNSLAQQKFQNQLGLTDAQIAAEMNGVNIAKGAAESNYYNARAKYYAGGGGGARSASQLNDIQNNILGALVSKGIITGGGGQPFKLAQGVTPAQALHAAQNIGSGYGSLPQNFLGGTVLGGVQGY